MTKKSDDKKNPENFSSMQTLNPQKHPFCGTQTNSADPDQTLQNVASDQGLHYSLTEFYIFIFE